MASEAYREIGAVGQPAFQNAWVNFNAATWSTAAFYKDSQGIVHLKGTLDGGTAGTTAFTLPVGYRPAKNSEFAIGGAGAATAADVFLFVLANGEVHQDAPVPATRVSTASRSGPVAKAPPA